MKKILALLLIFCMTLVFSPNTFAAAWKLPDGTPIYEAGCVIETDFGIFTVLDAGFAKKVETMNMVIRSGTKTVNGVSEDYEIIRELYDSAKDGLALFVVKGILENTTSNKLATKTIYPTIQFGTEDTVQLIAYPAINLKEFGSVTMSPGAEIEIEPGASIEIDFAATIPNKLYYGDSDILFQIAGATLGFQKEELQSYISMGFGEEDGVLTEDITEIAGEEQATGEKKQEEAAAPAHVDELKIEDISLEYNKTSNHYRLGIKVRNIDFPLIDGKTLQEVNIKFRFLDAAGEVVPSNRNTIEERHLLYQLPKGEATWIGRSQYIFTIDVGVVDTSDYTSFDSYELLFADNITGSRNARISGTYSEPCLFDLDDIIPGRADAKKAAESDAIIVDNVSVDFLDMLPSSVTGTSTYLAGIQNKYHFELSDSETYAVVQFSLTNMTTREMSLADTVGNFSIEVNFNNGFTYTTSGNKASVIQADKDTAIMECRGTSTYRIGDAITVAPLVTYDVIAYIPCAKLVATMTDKPLVVSFHTTQTGDKHIDVKVR